MSNYYKTLLLFIVVFLIIIFIRYKYENMENMSNIDYNIFYPVSHTERMYKIYNLQEQAHTPNMAEWGIPRMSPIGINSHGNLGEETEKWLFIIEYAKQKNKGANSVFKAFVKSESNGRWLTMTNNNVTTDGINKTLWTFTPIGNKYYNISTEDGRYLAYIDGGLVVTNVGEKLVLILDPVYI